MVRVPGIEPGSCELVNHGVNNGVNKNPSPVFTDDDRNNSQFTIELHPQIQSREKSPSKCPFTVDPAAIFYASQNLSRSPIYRHLRLVLV